MKDLHSTIKAVRAISPVNIGDNTPLVSQIIDRQGFEALEFIIATGTLSDANATFATLLEESDAANLSASNEVADADLFGTEAGASFTYDDDDTVLKIGYNGTKRYVRLTITPSGNAAATATTVIGAVAVLGSPMVKPQSDQSP